MSRFIHEDNHKKTIESNETKINIKMNDIRCQKRQFNWSPSGKRGLWDVAYFSLQRWKSRCGCYRRRGIFPFPFSLDDEVQSHAHLWIETGRNRFIDESRSTGYNDRCQWKWIHFGCDQRL